MKAYIIHENDEWTLPLKENLQKLSVPFEDWHMAKVNLNTASNPPEGVFYNRMSASSHSRGHRFAPEYTAVILNWLSSHKRRIINNESALSLEISKSAADHFTKPFITKHNRAGRGLGVKLFQNKVELEKYVRGSQFEESVDGITILQEYIEADPKVVTRVEFIDSKFFYAVQVDASDSFELCPADACNIEEQFCPTNPDGNKFMIVKNYQSPLIANYEKFLKANHIEVAGTEKKAGQFGMLRIAEFLKAELKKL
ncbi:MAG: alpha-L-glutamate ligase [Candidatus Fonsibacter ubiquis]|nr:alpha-L-glutamate ligase [Candidatus Fonsibacter ubiquis]